MNNANKNVSYTNIMDLAAEGSKKCNKIQTRKRQGKALNTQHF